MTKRSVRCQVAVVLVSICCVGCASPAITLIVWAGKLMLKAAVTQATVKVIDSLLGENAKEVKSEVKWNADDPNRGVMPVLKLERKENNSVIATESFTDVPVFRGADGKPHVEQYYTDTVIQPRLTKVNSK